MKTVAKKRMLIIILWLVYIAMAGVIFSIGCQSIVAEELKLLCEDPESAIAMTQVKMYEPKTESEEKPEDA